MRPLLVGQAPARTSGGRAPFDGPAGDRLAEVLGLRDRRDVPRLFDPRNLLDAWPGPSRGKGDAFPPAEARRAAARLLRREPHPRIVLAGRGIARAFGLGEAPWLREADLGGRRALVVPHPSGVVAWWNDPANRAEAARALRRFSGHPLYSGHSGLTIGDMNRDELKTDRKQRAVRYVAGYETAQADERMHGTLRVQTEADSIRHGRAVGTPRWNSDWSHGYLDFERGRPMAYGYLDCMS